MSVGITMGHLKRRIIEELEPTMAEWERRWIPVSERFPCDESMVLVWSQSNGLHLAYIDPWGQWRDADENPGKKITHWMPLPAPPSDGK